MLVDDDNKENEQHEVEEEEEDSFDEEKEEKFIQDFLAGRLSTPMDRFRRFSVA